MTQQPLVGASGVEVQLPAPRRPTVSVVVPQPDASALGQVAAAQAESLGAPAGRRRDWRSVYRSATIVADSAAAVLGLSLVRWSEPDLGWHWFAVALVPTVLVWIALVAVHHGYLSQTLDPGGTGPRAVPVAAVWLLGLLAGGPIVADVQPHRTWLAGLLLVVCASLVCRWLLLGWLRRARVRGRCRQRTILIGSAETVTDRASRLRTAPDHGIEIVGYCLSDTAGLDVEIDADPDVLSGRVEDLEALLAVTGPDLVMILPGSGLSGERLRRLAWRLETAGVEWVACAGITETLRHRVSVRSIGHAPMVQVAGVRLSGPARVLKGGFDRLGSLVGLVLVAPLLAVVGFAIWSHDGGSPFFCQTRVGRGGRQFRILKLRTMTVDAESRKAELLHHNESGGVLFKIVQDPRVTPIGQILRRYSIDELPQLLNVLRGEMSLVGPRPPLPEEVSEYSADMRRRLLVRPGMTGLWQVSGRSSLTWAQTEMLDLRYVENWSLSYDLLILARTFRAVISARGAC
ncbi:MAG TPA: sugar transferase [Sporichthyaceae bacterium]|jgi:exopolysaccharide biosynthesis polyprenyl glycosylphosphotransferase|nr:sugar transferase [Sporichthyaceae bacterium]